MKSYIVLATLLASLFAAADTPPIITNFTPPLVKTGTTVACRPASGSLSGCLGASDFTSFAAKQAALSFSAPIVNTSGTISCAPASGSVNGCLSSTDWNTFNNKQGPVETDFVTADGGTHAIASAAPIVMVDIANNSETVTLPDATTLLVGAQFPITAYVAIGRSFNQNTVTVKNSSGGNLSGFGTPTIYWNETRTIALTDNSSSDGTWVLQSFSPSNSLQDNLYSQNNVILWNGGTLETDYLSSYSAPVISVQSPLNVTGDGTIPELVVKGVISQGVNLQEWQDSANNPLAFVDPDGNINSSGNVAGNNLSASQDVSSSTMHATTFTGALVGNASTATTAATATTTTTATNATNVSTTQTSTSASFFPLFTASSTNGNQAVRLGTGLTFNPSTNTLSTTTFSGALSGNASTATSATTATTATNATNIATTQVSTNASFFPTFVSSSSTGNQAADIGTGLSFNPSTNALTTTDFYAGNGAATTPTLSFSSDTTTGFSLITGLGANGMVNLNVHGIQMAQWDRWDNSGTTAPYMYSVRVLGDDGQAAIPQFAFYNRPNTGIYRATPNGVAVSSGGTERFIVDSTGITFFNGLVYADRVATTTPVTVATTDSVVVTKLASPAAVAVNLPASPETGREYIVKDGTGDANLNPITVTPAAGNIDNAATYVININLGAARFVYNGTQWNAFNESPSVMTDVSVAGSDFTTTSATAVSVTGLGMTVAASTNYDFKCHLDTGSGTSGLKFALTVPSGATFLAHAFGVSTGSTTYSEARMNTSGTLTTAFSTLSSSATFVDITGRIRNSTTAGTLQVQTASGDGVQTASIFIDSYCTLQQAVH